MVSYVFPMVILHVSYAFAMVLLWFPYGFSLFPMLSQLFPYRSLKNIVWPLIKNLLINGVCVFSYGFLCFPYGHPTCFLCFCYGFTMVSLWLSYDFLCFPTVFIWFSNGFPIALLKNHVLPSIKKSNSWGVVFLWFLHYGFPMVIL